MQPYYGPFGPKHAFCSFILFSHIAPSVWRAYPGRGCSTRNSSSNTFGNWDSVALKPMKVSSHVEDRGLVSVTVSYYLLGQNLEVRSVYFGAMLIHLILSHMVDFLK